MAKLQGYHRPKSVQEAVALLTRPQLETAVLAGGTYLTAQLTGDIDEVVDLQEAGLGHIHLEGRRARIGAMARLAEIAGQPELGDLLPAAAQRELPNTLRNAATIGGIIAGRDWESELLTTLLVVDAIVSLAGPSGEREQPLMDYLQQPHPAATLITAVTISADGHGAAARTGRTPADKPIVCAVARVGHSGMLHLALSGVAATPVRVAADAVALLVPPDDFRGSSEYRLHLAQVLSARVIAQVSRS